MNPAQVIFISAFVLLMTVFGAMALWFDEDTTDVFEEDE